MQIIRVSWFIVLVVCSVAGIGCSPQQSSTPKAKTSGRSPTGHGEFGDQTLEVGKESRRYRLVVPATIDLSKPVPLVIAFHGMLIDSKDLMPKYTQLNKTAEEKEFIVVYPEAIGKSWGIIPEKVTADLAFFDALNAKVTADYKIDPDRVFVLGMSNGGYFAHLVGKERSQTVAAVASHSGPLGLQTLFGVRADRKFPVMIIHGDKDQIFPIEFARENRDKYKREGHEVSYIELPDQGHMWATKSDINESIWEFFRKHPRKQK